MTLSPEQIVENVKRLRELYDPAFSHAVDDFMQTISALVDLVGEMHENGGKINTPDYDASWVAFDATLTKSSPIAELARGK